MKIKPNIALVELGKRLAQCGSLKVWTPKKEKQDLSKDIWKEVWNLCRDYGHTKGFEAVEALQKKYGIYRRKQNN